MCVGIDALSGLYYLFMIHEGANSYGVEHIQVDGVRKRKWKGDKGKQCRMRKKSKVLITDSQKRQGAA